MRQHRRGRDLILRLDPGEGIHETLRATFAELGIDAAAITSGIGQLREVEVGFLHPDGNYDVQAVPGAVELLSLQGTLGVGEDGGGVTHLHVVLLDAAHAVHGGHLVASVVNVVAEIHARIVHETGDIGPSPLTRHPVEGSQMLVLRVDGS